MRSWLLLLASLVTGCSAAQTTCGALVALSDIPLLRYGHHEIIPVEINHQPAGLAMDTGSSATTITPDAVNDFDLTTTRVTEQGAGRGNQLFVSASGLGGDGRYQIVEIPSLTIGGMRAQDVEAPVIPLFRDGLRSFPAYVSSDRISWRNGTSTWTWRTIASFSTGLRTARTFHRLGTATRSRFPSVRT